jgi:hypothetical protein
MTKLNSQSKLTLHISFESDRKNEIGIFLWLRYILKFVIKAKSLLITHSTSLDTCNFIHCSKSRLPVTYIYKFVYLTHFLLK